MSRAEFAVTGKRLEVWLEAPNGIDEVVVDGRRFKAQKPPVTNSPWLVEVKLLQRVSTGRIETYQMPGAYLGPRQCVIVRNDGGVLRTYGGVYGESISPGMELWPT